MSQKLLWLLAALLVCAWAGASRATTVTVAPTVIGTTPQYVGFSQGDYVTGTNTSAWVDYSNANAFRIWSAPGVYPSEVSPAPTIATQSQFDARKAALRSDPNSTTYTDWNGLATKFASPIKSGSNILSLDYALGALNTRNIHVIEQMTRTVSNPVTDWQGKWEQWQAYYAQAFYEARNYNVAQFQIYNEPDLSSGETPADLLVRLQLASDAIHSAIADVDTLYHKTLVASVAGPTSAGSSSTTFATWGKPLLAANRTDYEGNPTSYDLFDTYDFHLYTSTASSFATNIQYAKTNVPLFNASGNSMPVILTEFNYETSATFANNNDSLRDPKIVSGIAADLIAATSVNVDGLYGFKFSQTPYNSTAQGTIPQPTGFYYLDSANTDNITGSTPAAEAYRLYTKAFKGARNRVSTSAAQTGATFTMAAAIDPTAGGAGGTYYAYASNTATTTNPITLDLTGWNIQPGALVTIEEVSARRMGEVTNIFTVPANRQITFTQPAQAVDLITAPQGTPQHIIPISATASAQVRYNPSDSTSKTTNYSGSATDSVARSTASNGNNYASYLKFDLTNQDRSKVSRAILSLTGQNITNSNVATFEVYGILNDTWSESTLTWSTAPDLAATSPTLTNVGSDAFPVGHLSFDSPLGTSMIDVTTFLQQFPDNLVTFALVREQQYAGEPDDGSRVTLLSRTAGAGAPQLLLFSSQTPEPALPLIVCTLAAFLRRRRKR